MQGYMAILIHNYSSNIQEGIQILELKVPKNSSDENPKSRN